MIILYANFGLISFTNNGVIRVLCCCYGNVHLKSHIFWSFRSVLQDILGWNVLITSIYFRNKGVRLQYEEFFKSISFFYNLYTVAMVTGTEMPKHTKLLFLCCLGAFFLK